MIMSEAKLDPWHYRISERGRRVEVGPDIDRVRLEDATGRPVGEVLGFPIDLARELRLTGGVHRMAATYQGDVDAFAEAVLEDLAGRFLWLCRIGDSARIYLDPAGQVPCVFDPDRGVAACSAHSLLDAAAYDSRFDRARYDRLGVDGLGWVPGGLTTHEGVRRLLPNHRLDLDDFSVARHWPLVPLGQGDDPDAELAVVVESIQAHYRTFAKGPRKMALALTAGRETRILLACARDRLGEVEFVTMGTQANVDTVMARQIAGKLGLNHRFLPTVQATEAQRRLYLRRNGECVTDTNSWVFPSVAPLAQNHVFIGGIGGEIGRGFFWRPSDTAGTPIDGAALMGRFGLPADDAVIAGLERWLAGLRGRSTLEILDLAYIEHRLGPWGNAQFPSDPTLVRYAPMLTRPSVRALMRLPDDWKRHEGMSAAVLRQTWPELLEFPFNTLGRWRDTMAKLARVGRDPGTILRVLRKRFG